MIETLLESYYALRRTHEFFTFQYGGLLLSLYPMRRIA
jgi:hypothetical protein